MTPTRRFLGANRVLWITTALIGCALAGPAGAQSSDQRGERGGSDSQAPDPELVAVATLMGEGEAQRARERLSQWLERSGAGADPVSVEWSLWLGGRLSLDPDRAVAQYRRLIDEYPEGRFANPARIRLAQAAEARGDRTESTRWMQAVLETDPDSTSKALATAWLAAHSSAPTNTVASTDPDTEEPERALSSDDATAERESDPGEDVAEPEPSPVVGAAGGRAAAEAEGEPPPVAGASGGEAAVEARVPAAVIEAGSEDAVTPPRVPVPPDAAEGPFAVQIGAYLSTARANRMAERLSEAGFVSRVVKVPGSPLFRVRTGRYAELDDARVVAESVAAAGFATYIGDNARREQPVPPG